MGPEKIALVSGGCRGIGQAVVHQLCRQQVRAVFTCRNPHDGHTALAAMGSMAKYAAFHPLEVTDEGSVAALTTFIQRRYGRLDVLVNNAGTGYDAGQRAGRVAMSEVSHTIDVNLLGPWRLCNSLLPLVRASGAGRIINVSSGAGCLASHDGSVPAYAVAKAGLNMLTFCLARDLAEENIAVNAVDPGWVRTEMGGPNAPKSPAEGADTIVWLATEAAQSLSGGLYRNRSRIDW